jgi:hypothetical protein
VHDDFEEHESRRRHAVHDALSAFANREIIVRDLTGIRPGLPLSMAVSWTDLPDDGESLYVCVHLQKTYQSVDPTDDLALRKFAHWQLCCTQGHGCDHRKGEPYTPVRDDDHEFFRWQEQARASL